MRDEPTEAAATCAPLASVPLHQEHIRTYVYLTEWQTGPVARNPAHLNVRPAALKPFPHSGERWGVSITATTHPSPLLTSCLSPATAPAAARRHDCCGTSLAFGAVIPCPALRAGPGWSPQPGGLVLSASCGIRHRTGGLQTACSAAARGLRPSGPHGPGNRTVTFTCLHTEPPAAVLCWLRVLALGAGSGPLSRWSVLRPVPRWAQILDAPWCARAQSGSVGGWVWHAQGSPSPARRGPRPVKATTRRYAMTCGQPGQPTLAVLPRGRPMRARPGHSRPGRSTS